MAVLLVIGVALAVITFGGLRRNWFLSKAERLKEQIDAAEKAARIEQQLQVERLARAKKIAAEKAELDKIFKETMQNLDVFGLMAILTASLLVGCVAVGHAAEAGIPGDYEKLAALYYNTLDELVNLKDQRDEFITIAEGYKGQLEALLIEYEKAEASVTRLNETVKTLQDLADKQNEIIKKLASRGGLGLLGGVTLTPLDDFVYRPGILVGIQWAF